MLLGYDLDFFVRSGLAAALLFAVLAIVEARLPGRGPRDPRIGRLGLNFALLAAGAALALLVPFSTSIAAGIAEREGIGLFQRIEAPAAAVLAAALLTRTFLAYWLHRASHRWAWLWRIHRVHHSDRSFDLSLALRHHPFEGLVAIAVYGSAGLALGLPLWAALAVDLAMLAASLWEHVDIDLPAGLQRRLAPWLVTPDWHRVHHSARQPETDSNFGVLLVVWDRLFGTSRQSAEAPERIGLGTASDRLAESWLAQLASPFTADRHWRGG